MNKSFIALTLGAATLATAAFFPTDDSGAVPPPGPGPIATPEPLPIIAPPAQTAAPRIEVVFALDTTGSMSGLLQGAKDKIWSIASSMAQAEPAPEIRMGLVAYRDRGDAYVTRHVDLSTDLDSVYAELMELRAEGGGDHHEAVNQALNEAVEQMSWSADGDVYRVVFLVGDAPPHMDYAGEAQYPQILERANARGIVVNAIQCGTHGVTTRTWRHIANLSQGEFLQVEQNGSAIAVATPFDEKLASLSSALDETRVFFGDEETMARLEKKDAATSKLKAAAPTAVLARRAAFNASASGAANLAGKDDLVAAVEAGRVDLDSVEADMLPAPLRAMDAEARKRYVTEQSAARAALKSEISELAEARDAFIARELEAEGGDAASFGARIYDTVRRQAAEVGLEYDAAARH